MRLTPDGVRVVRQLAMLGEDGQDALMAALLGEDDARYSSGTGMSATVWRSVGSSSMDITM